MKTRFSRFHLITLAVFLTAGAAMVGFTQHSHLRREAMKRANREAAALATAEELLRRQEVPKLPFVVEEKRMSEQGPEHWLLELKLRFRNEGPKPVVLEPPLASLNTEDGNPVPEFFLALSPPPVVSGGSEEEVELRYWLNAAQRQQPLWLEIQGDRLALDL